MNNAYFLNMKYLQSRMDTSQRLQLANIYSGRLSIVNVDRAREQFYADD